MVSDNFNLLLVLWYTSSMYKTGYVLHCTVVFLDRKHTTLDKAFELSTMHISDVNISDVNIGDVCGVEEAHQVLWREGGPCGEERQT